MILEYVNGSICTAICLRLMLFRQGKCSHKIFYSIVAYVLTVATASIAIRSFMQQYTQADLAEVLINSIVCICVFISKGNIANILRWQTK